MPSKDNQFRIFLLGKNSVIPKDSFNSCLHARVFAYIAEKRTDNSIVALYEKITYHEDNEYEIERIKSEHLDYIYKNKMDNYELLTSLFGNANKYKYHYNV